MRKSTFWTRSIQRLSQFVQQNLRNSKIRKRLIFSFLILTVIPITSIGAFFYITTYRDNEAKSIQYSRNISTQLMRNISSVFDNYVEQFERVSMDNTTVVEVYTYDSLKVFQQIEVYSRIRHNLASVVWTSKGVDSFEIRTKNGEQIYCASPISNKTISSSQILKNASGNDRISWTFGKKETGDDESSYIILAKKMVVQFGKDITGFAVMAIDKNYIDTLCAQMNLEEKMYVVITDQNGTIISHPSQGLTLTSFDPAINAKITSLEALDSPSAERFFKQTLNGEEVLISYDILTKNQWRVISIIPYSYLMASTIRNGFITLIAILTVILVSILVAVLVTKSIANPVNRLLAAMEETGHGNLDVRLEDQWTLYHDEHAQLAQGFNQMNARLQKLVGEVYDSELHKIDLEFRKKEAELNALQQQINPHFLYNILETIYWMAESKGEQEIGEMVTALGNFFRRSISKGKEFVTVGEEVQNVQSYVYLQKIRFQDRFEVEWFLDDQVLSLYMIKLILQPIVENAIVHGVESLEKGGRITIKGSVSQDLLIFEVTDNGKGMSQDAVEQFEKHINNSQPDQAKSVGVKNVHQRIRLYHGDNYGVALTSEENVGTKVRIVLPVIRNLIDQPVEDRGADKNV